MVTRCQDGSLIFEFYRPNATTVHIAGTFNRWSPEAIAMTQREDGWWTCTITTIEPGDHSFQYVVNGSEWEADFAASGVELNGFGSWVSRLVVKPNAIPQTNPETGSGAPAGPLTKHLQRIPSRIIERELEMISDLLHDAGERLRNGSERKIHKALNGNKLSQPVFGTHIPAAVEVPVTPVYVKKPNRRDKNNTTRTDNTDKSSAVAA